MTDTDETEKPILSLIYALVSTLENAEFRLDKPGVRVALQAQLKIAESLRRRCRLQIDANHRPRLLRG